jgi:hypothetical protein
MATAALALICAGPAFAQSTSDSTSGATSGSTSGAAANNVNQTANGAQTTTVAPVNNGDSRATSGSSSNAETSSNSQASGGTSYSGASGGNANAANGSASSGNNQGVTINSTTPKEQTVRTAPQVYAPALTTTLTETCMGSTSLGGSGVGVGVTIGTTWHDKDCVRRLNARELAQTLGDRDAARALLCEDEAIRTAYEKIGRSCYTPVAVNAPAPMPPAPPEAPPTVALPAPQSVPVPPINSKGTMEPIPNPTSHSGGERG